MAVAKTSRKAAAPEDAAPPGGAPVALICGGDDFAVKQRARQLFQQWCEAAGGMDHETIDARVNNTDEALGALGRLREALQTLPFFGGAKVVWFRDCNFLGEERTSSSQAVLDSLADLAAELKAFSWQGVRLLLSASKPDQRRTFFKTLQKLGTVEVFEAWSVDDKDWAARAETTAARTLRARGKQLEDEALAALVQNVGPNPAQLASEAEKLALYVGDRADITVADVEAIVTRNRQARAFAVADALGDRQLPRLVRALEEELWSMQFDKQKSEIGLLYGIIAKVRVLLFLKEMVREGWIQPQSDYARFKAQLERVPADQLPEDRKFNPLAQHPFVLHKALGQLRLWTSEELVRAMGLLLDCNRRLVGSSLDERLVLQQTLLEIARPAPKG
ncbi:MAG: polymerase subunit delta [Verrucomicrobiota bacterium]|jgi:DNA polymerase-3 subunit delta